MDISAIEQTGTLDTLSAAERGAPCHLVHPSTDTPLTDNGVDLTITVKGSDAQVFEAQRDAASNKFLRNVGRRGGVDQAEVRAQQIATLAAATVGWTLTEKFMQLVGLPPETAAFNKANAIKLYSKVPWVREQVDQFAGQRANFLSPT